MGPFSFSPVKNINNKTLHNVFCLFAWNGRCDIQAVKICWVAFQIKSGTSFPFLLSGHIVCHSSRLPSAGYATLLKVGGRGRQICNSPPLTKVHVTLWFNPWKGASFSPFHRSQQLSQPKKIKTMVKLSPRLPPTMTRSISLLGPSG